MPIIKNDNRKRRRPPLEHVTTKRQEVSLPKEILEKAQEAQSEKMDVQLNADHLAILFIAQRGRQPLISILQGVNATRIPIGKKPLNEKKVLSLLEDLVNEGFLIQSELHDQQTWITSAKVKDLEL